MATEYRTVHDLTPEELDELRAAYWEQLQENDSDVIDGEQDYHSITNKMLFNHYDGVSFVRDDFFCNMTEESED